jgi:hypothetical protein
LRGICFTYVCKGSLELKKVIHIFVAILLYRHPNKYMAGKNDTLNFCDLDRQFSLGSVFR